MWRGLLGEPQFKRNFSTFFSELCALAPRSLRLTPHHNVYPEYLIRCRVSTPSHVTTLLAGIVKCRHLLIYVRLIFCHCVSNSIARCVFKCFIIDYLALSPTISLYVVCTATTRLFDN